MAMLVYQRVQDVLTSKRGISEPSRVSLVASFRRHPTFNGTGIRHPGCLKVQAYTCKSCNISIHNSYRHCRMHTNFGKKLTHEAFMTLNPTPRTCAEQLAKPGRTQKRWNILEKSHGHMLMTATVTKYLNLAIKTTPTSELQ